MSFRKDCLEQFYDIGEKLGSGAFSEVKLATEKATGKKYAAKIVSKISKDESEKRFDIITTEIKILQKVSHRNIVGLKDVFENDKEVILVLELITGGELFDKIVELVHYSEKDASKITAQILEAVRHLHANNIVHRDLKPENLLLSSQEPDSDIKITDFGLSKIFEEGEKIEMTHAVGTPSYLAPEVLTLLDDGIPYGKEVDMWGVGVILYIILCGFPPFFGDDEEEVYDKITAGQWKFLSPYWDHVSNEAKDLVSKLLVLDRKKRFTAEQALAHPWIASRENVSDANLEETIVQLKKYNAKRKFKGAILAVKALTKLNKLKI